MKVLNTVVFAAPETDTTYINQILSAVPNAVTVISTNEPEVLTATNAHSYDMLIIDKALGEIMLAKWSKLSDLLYPESATLEMHLNDQSFVAYKIAEMVGKWKEANTGGGFNFIDNPVL